MGSVLSRKRKSVGCGRKCSKEQQNAPTATKTASPEDKVQPKTSNEPKQNEDAEANAAAPPKDEASKEEIIEVKTQETPKECESEAPKEQIAAEEPQKVEPKKELQQESNVEKEHEVVPKTAVQEDQSKESTIQDQEEKPKEVVQKDQASEQAVQESDEQAVQEYQTNDAVEAQEAEPKAEHEETAHEEEREAQVEDAVVEEEQIELQDPEPIAETLKEPNEETLSEEPTEETLKEEPNEETLKEEPKELPKEVDDCDGSQPKTTDLEFKSNEFEVEFIELNWTQTLEKPCTGYGTAYKVILNENQENIKSVESKAKFSVKVIEKKLNIPIVHEIKLLNGKSTTIGEIRPLIEAKLGFATNLQILHPFVKDAENQTTDDEAYLSTQLKDDDIVLDNLGESDSIFCQLASNANEEY